MLVGQHSSKLSAKNRVAFPKKFREELGSEIIVTRGYEGCLVAVDFEKWEKITKDVVEGNFIDRRVRDSGRFLLAGAHEVEMDNQGRFVIPKGLVDYGELEEEAIFIGLVNWVEIWSKEKWMEHEEFLKNNGENIAQEIADLVSAGSTSEK
jgi:MraZ protein